MFSSPKPPPQNSQRRPAGSGCAQANSRSPLCAEYSSHASARTTSSSASDSGESTAATTRVPSPSRPRSTTESGAHDAVSRSAASHAPMTGGVVENSRSRSSTSSSSSSLPPTPAPAPAPTPRSEAGDTLREGGGVAGETERASAAPPDGFCTTRVVVPPSRDVSAATREGGTHAAPAPLASSAGYSIGSPSSPMCQSAALPSSAHSVTRTLGTGANGVSPSPHSRTALLCKPVTHPALPQRHAVTSFVSRSTRYTSAEPPATATCDCEPSVAAAQTCGVLPCAASASHCPRNCPFSNDQSESSPLVVTETTTSPSLFVNAVHIAATRSPSPQRIDRGSMDCSAFSASLVMASVLSFPSFSVFFWCCNKKNKAFQIRKR